MSLFSFTVEPCFFHNMGGCERDDCKYLHIRVDRIIEKPQDIKTPCKYYHLNGICKNVGCRYGHVQLAKYRWNNYFAKNYPGKNYNKDFIWKNKN